MFGPSRRVARRTARRTARRQAYFQDAMSGGYAGSEPEYDAPPPPAASPAQPDYAAELEKLAGLREQGIINEEEFEAKKRQILGI
jgi:Short C-terminal domain